MCSDLNVIGYNVTYMQLSETDQLIIFEGFLSLTLKATHNILQFLGFIGLQESTSKLVELK